MFGCVSDGRIEIWNLYHNWYSMYTITSNASIVYVCGVYVCVTFPYFTTGPIPMVLKF